METNFTEKQKQAIYLLNNLLHDKHLDEEEYLELLDFVVNPTQQGGMTYIPCPIEIHPWQPQYPIVTYGTGTPYQYDTNKIMCNNQKM